MLYIAYLDEFGHIGPYLSKAHAKFNESPVFGFGGIILPYHEVRMFGSWFFRHKCRLLDWEIRKSDKPAWCWEKKGSSLYTVKNVKKYRELRTATNRLLNKIGTVNGRLFYCGLEKPRDPANHDSEQLYLHLVAESLKRLDHFAKNHNASIQVVMDEHQDREKILTRATAKMYAAEDPRTNIIEPPFQVESERYQTIQCADWICGIMGRLFAYAVSESEYADNEIFEKYFGKRIGAVTVPNSGLKKLESMLL